MLQSQAPLPTEMLSRAASESLAALDSIFSILDNVSSIGSVAGIAASSRRGEYFEGD